MSIKPGIRLGERYQLLTLIASGGMGQVWRAEDTTLHRVVAAKILRSEFTGDETFLARFRAEARNTASLSHPNIASVYDYGEQVHDSERLCYLVMELVEGKPLVDILARERRLSPDRTLDYLEQTAMGLAAAHRQNMVHRDIKPGNLIIRPDGVVKITDFGIARAANSVALTERGTVVGTAQYLAPEQAEGKPAQPTSDIYALGVVGYECLAGFRPFDGDNSVAIALAQIRETPRPLPADVPPHVRALIEIAMRKDPNARYADGMTFIPVVRQVRAGGMPPQPVIRGPQPVAPAQPGPPATAVPPAQQPPAPAAVPPTPAAPAAPPGPGPLPPVPANRGASSPGAPNVRGPAPRGPVPGGPSSGGPTSGGPVPGGPAPGPGVPAGGTQPGQPPANAQDRHGRPQPTPPPQQGNPAPRPCPQPVNPAPPGGTGTFPTGQGVVPGTGSYPQPPGGTGSYPVSGPGQPPPGAQNDVPSARRTVLWFWVALSVLLVAAVVALAVVLINQYEDSERTGAPPMTTTSTELKTNTDLKETMP